MMQMLLSRINAQFHPGHRTFAVQILAVILQVQLGVSAAYQKSSEPSYHHQWNSIGYSMLEVTTLSTQILIILRIALGLTPIQSMQPMMMVILPPESK